MRTCKSGSQGENAVHFPCLLLYRTVLFRAVGFRGLRALAHQRSAVSVSVFGSGFFNVPTPFRFMPFEFCSLLTPVQDQLWHQSAVLPGFFATCGPYKAVRPVTRLIIAAVTSPVILTPIRSFPGNRLRWLRSLLRSLCHLPVFL